MEAHRVHAGRSERAAAPLGRERELTALREELARAARGTGRIVLVSGEPGIGKTVVAEAAAVAAAESGAVVAWGQCWEGGDTPPYWPWAQVLADLATRPELAAAWQGERAAIARALADGDPPMLGPSEDPAVARFRLLDAVAGQLAALAADRPLTVVIEDVHAADEGSLALLDFLAHRVRKSAVLVVATHREAEARLREDVDGHLRRLRRGALALELGGVTTDAVHWILARTLGSLPSPEVVEDVRDRTGGNPLFVEGVARLMAEGGVGAGVGVDVREQVRGWVTLLSAQARELLSAAAVIGREFDATAAAGAIGLDVASVLGLLDDARRAGLVLETGVPGRLRFRHALVRDCLEDELASSRRLELHDRVADVLAGTGASGVDVVARIAHHRIEAAPLHGAGPAVAAARGAAARFTSVAAHTEAAQLLRRALAVLDVARVDGADRLELLLDLGGALRNAGAPAEAARTLREAVEQARSLGDPVLVARAALAAVGRPSGGGAVTAWRLELLDEAVARLGDGHPALTARLLARRATEFTYADPPAHRLALAARAAELARDSGDDEALFQVLNARVVAASWLDSAPERLETTGEILRLATRLGDPQRAAQAHLHRVTAFLETTDPPSAWTELERFAYHAKRLRDPGQLHQLGVVEALRSTLCARLEEAERQALAAASLGQEHRLAGAEQTVALQIYMIRWEQGRGAEMIDAVGALLERQPTVDVWRSALALTLAECGREDEAREVFAPLLRRGLESVERSPQWAHLLSSCAHAVRVLADPEPAARLVRLMEPYAEHGHVQVIAGAPASYLGPFRYTLGVALEAMEEWTPAIEHHEAGLAIHQAHDVRLLAVRSAAALARALAARRSPGDVQRARGVAEPALAAARRCGLHVHVPDLEAALVARETRAAVRREPGRRVVLRREGDVWAVGDPAAPARLRDARGLGLLAELIADPGVERHAAELAAGSAWAPPTGTGGEEVHVEGAVAPALDAEAKSAYRARIEDLREELEEAERFNDPERAARAQEELEFLGRELERALGLSGRDRPAVASGAERARSAVTKALRRAIDRIAAGDPLLGEHLRLAVRTGTFCIYEPDPHSGVTWDLDTG